MRKIELVNNRGVALVDADDFEKLSLHRWYLHPKGCACRHDHKRMVLMHRHILGINDPKIKVDHANHNPLDNQKNNLRPCTQSQNRMNSVKPINNISGYKGVCLNGHTIRKRPWQAQIKALGKIIYLGYFATAKEAARAYNHAAQEYFGEFACLNKI